MQACLGEDQSSQGTRTAVQDDQPHAIGLTSNMRVSHHDSFAPKLIHLMMDTACVKQTYFVVSDALTSLSSSLSSSNTSALSSPSCRLHAQHGNLQVQTPIVSLIRWRATSVDRQPDITTACTLTLCKPIVCVVTCNSANVILPGLCLNNALRLPGTDTEGFNVRVKDQS